MPSWVRLGQQVTLRRPWARGIEDLARRRGDTLPVYGQVYTIRLVDLAPSRRGVPGPYLQFRELRNSSHAPGCPPGEARFRWTFFQPVTRAKSKAGATQAQDVELIKGLLTKLPIPVDA